MIEYTRAVRRRQIGNNVRGSLVIRYRRVHAIVVFVLQPKRRIDVALTRRAGIGDVRRGAVMRVGQKPGHRPGWAVHAARIIVRVRELGALEHSVAEKNGRILIPSLETH